jgi:hypothetical protein
LKLKISSSIDRRPNLNPFIPKPDGFVVTDGMSVARYSGLRSILGRARSIIGAITAKTGDNSGSVRSRVVRPVSDLLDRMATGLDGVMAEL